MKNLKKVFAVSLILMQLVLAFAISTSTAPAAASEPEGIAVCCDMPPIDTF
jgi:hypothetical protein